MIESDCETHATQNAESSTSGAPRASTKQDDSRELEPKEVDKSNMESEQQREQQQQQQHRPSDQDDSSLERSFEVLSPNYKSNQAAGDASSQTATDGQNSSTTKATASTAKRQDSEDDSVSRTSSSTQGAAGRRESLKERIKKSTSFLSKLQTSSSSGSQPTVEDATKREDKTADDVSTTANDSSTSTGNLTSGLANAFSSFSSFTSNFGFNQATNGNSSAGANHSLGLAIETASTSTRQSQNISESRDEIFAKKAALERKNLINLTKLIVKDLISTSLVSGRTIEDCHNTTHLNNYFTLIDRVLKHGLKQSLLSNRSASLWTALDNLPKYLNEATLMSESVRSLAHTKTPDGKIKAWIRLAMMQKKLPDYFNELLANKSALLKDVYHEHAFMLNDEAQVFAGLIIGVNVIDCNFFVKDANFDLMDDIIELGPYLRAANPCDEDVEEAGGNPLLSESSESDETRRVTNLTKVLDQKNYLEEWNKRLELTISDLRDKIKHLQEQNSKLEMEAKVTEARMLKLSSAGRAELFSFGQQPERSSTPTSLSASLPEALKNLINGASTNQEQAKSNAPPARSESNSVSQQQQGVSVEKESFSDKTFDNEISAEERVEAQPERPELSSINQEQLDKYQERIAEQEKELASALERVGILESSYRNSLDKIKTLERDLDVKTSVLRDKETTIKIYEKDIREKQAQVETLRASLADAKKFNADLNERLNDASAKLKDRIKCVSNLQESLDKWKLENKQLASRLQDKQQSLKVAQNELENSRKIIEDLKKYNEKINDELRRERECGHSSSVQVETQSSKITQLSEQLARLELELNEARPYRKQAEELKRLCHDYEQSLEEVGSQLRDSRLEVESLKENSSVFLDSQWMDSKQVKQCALCEQQFSVTRRKHHCRLCGNVFCQTCSDNKMELASSSKPVRVCDTCHSFLLAKYVKSSSASANNSVAL